MSLSSPNQGICNIVRIAYASYGDPPVEFSGRVTKMCFDIHNFAYLEEKRGESFKTGTIIVHGHPWALWVFPLGHDNSSTDTENMSIFLYYAGNTTRSNPVVAKATVSTKSLKEEITRPFAFSSESTSESTFYSRGWYDFGKREDMINNDCDEAGTLTIEVDLEIATKKKPVWYPQSVSHSNGFLFELYKSIDITGDVSFIIGNSGKEWKAHKCVLALRAKELHELVVVEEESSRHKNDSDSDNDNDIINIVLPDDVDETEFQAMLDFIYTGKEPKLNNQDEKYTAKSFLVQADRFGCTDLKLYLESILIHKCLTPSTAAELLLFADSHSCALLKEASMNTYAEYPRAVMMYSQNDWAKLAESNKLLSELLVYTTHPGGRKQYLPVGVKDGNGNGNNGTTLKDADNLDVTSLRERLQKANLDIDGSREMLVERWKEHLRLFASECHYGRSQCPNDHSMEEAADATDSLTEAIN